MLIPTVTYNVIISDGRGKRRKLGSRTNMTGHVQGDIVWAKYRNHPVWPAKVLLLSAWKRVFLQLS